MCYGYQTWSEEFLMQVYDDDDLHGGQRSSEVKSSKLCAMVTKRGQKNPLCKFKMMLWLQILGQNDLMMMMTFSHGGHAKKRSSKVKWGKLQRSKLRAVATIMVKRITDASLK